MTINQSFLELFLTPSFEEYGLFFSRNLFIAMSRDDIDLTLITCPICTDPLCDPRVLPCGHSFCGPPKPCLQGVKKFRGLKCPVCKEDFPVLSLSELKPLFGIRDFIAKASANSDHLESLCIKHVTACRFWCDTCQEKCCHQCITNMGHENHDLADYRSYLHNSVKTLYRTLEAEHSKKGEKIDRILRYLHWFDDFVKEEASSSERRISFTQGDKDELQESFDKWKEISKFVEDLDYKISLPVVEAFLKQNFDEFYQIGMETEVYSYVPSSLDFSFQTRLVYCLLQNPPIDAIVVTNEKYRLEILFSKFKNQSFCMSGKLCADEHLMLSGTGFKGEMVLFQRDVNTAEKRIYFQGVCNRNGSVFLPEMKVPIEIFVKDLDELTKTNFFTSGFYFQIEFTHETLISGDEMLKQIKLL